MRKKEKIYSLKFKILIFLVVILVVGSAVKAFDKSQGKMVKNDNCPEDMVFVGNDKGGFCVDKYENSTGAKCPLSNPANQEESRTNLDSPDCRPEAKAASIPWVNITQRQAMAACAKAGKRLPTNQEWHQASLGTSDPKDGWAADDCQVDSNWDIQPGPAGSGKNCVSGAGAYDMIGNVWEWVNGLVENGEIDGRILPDEGYVQAMDNDFLPSSTDANTPDSDFNEDYMWLKKNGQRAVARGGYWGNKSEAGANSLYIVSPATYAGVGMGFRCVK